MRIISGIAGGIRLAAPGNHAVRPTSDRVKESIFNVLGDLRGCKVLDLFAGSGALGLEALSRGASLVVFVESNRRHIRLIEKNIAIVRAAMGTAFAETCVIAGDAVAPQRLAEMPPPPYDVIIADPPYSGSAGTGELLASPGFPEFTRNAVLVVEHATRTPLPITSDSSWKMLKTSRFGSTTVSYLRLKESSS